MDASAHQTDRDLLFAVFAVQLGLASADRAMAAAAAWAADRSLGLVERLVRDAGLSEADRALVGELVSRAVSAHGGSAPAALESLGGGPGLLHSIGGPAFASGAEDVAASDAGASGADADALGVTDEHSGRYSRGRELGRGGIGRVVAAFDAHIGREVAVKELLAGSTLESHPNSGGDLTGTSGPLPPEIRRFLREARVTGQLEHPSIVPVYEVGRRDDGTLYYAMRLVRGRTLGAALAAADGLSGRLALMEHFSDLCQALAFAHCRGVIHRDLKPDNVMVGEFGETVVLDWGLAKVRGRSDIQGQTLARDVEAMREDGAGQTVAGSALGTPAFMSPEQAEGDLERVDERSDVWGLGAVLYVLLTGRPPYEGSHPYEVVGRVMTEAPPPVRDVCPEAPVDLSDIAAKAMSRDRADRYADAGALASDVSAWLTGRRVSAHDYTSLELLRRFVARNKAATAAALVALLAVVVALVQIYGAYVETDRARSVAENQRDVAQQARTEALAHKARAEVSQREARASLAAAFLEKARRAISDGDASAGRIFAAAALVNDPGNPAGPHHQPSPDDPEDVAALRLTKAHSDFYDSDARGLLRYAGRVELPHGSAAAAGARKTELGVERYFLMAAGVAPDGDHVAVLSGDGQLTVLSLEGRDPPIFARSDVDTYVHGELPWLGDGEYVLSHGGSEGPAVRRGRDLEPVATLGVAALTRYLALGPKGQQVAVVGTDDWMGVWTVSNPLAPELVWKVETRDTSQGYVGWAPDGDSIAAESGRAVTLRDATDGTVRWTTPLSSIVIGVAFGGDGQRIFALGNGSVLWSLRADDGAVMREQQLDRLMRHIVVADHRHWMLVGGQYGHGEVWSGDGSRVLDRLHGQPARRGCLAIAPGAERIVSAEGDGFLRLWRVERPTLARRVTTGARLHYIAVAQGGQTLYLTTMTDDIEVVRLPREEGETETRRRISLPPAPGEDPGVLCGAPSPDERWLAAVGLRGRLTLLDLKGDEPGKVLWDGVRPGPGTRFFRAPAYSADSRLLFYVGGDGRAVIRRDLASGVELAPLRVAGRRVYTLALSSDGARAAATNDEGVITLWSLPDGSELWHVKGHEGAATGLDFAPDGSMLVSSGVDAQVRVWDAATGERRQTLSGHSQWVNGVWWSPDGRWILSVGDDSVALLWDTRTWRVAQIHRSGGHAIVGAFTSDSRHFWVNDDNDAVRHTVVADEREADPVKLLRDAELRAGVRLQGLELVPMTE